MSSQPLPRISENIAALRERIANAAVRSGRATGDVTLVAVVKYVNADLTRAVVEAGCFDLGESRPQSLWAKASEIDDPRVRWHMIGHLQRNKARRTAEIASLIHSGDSLRLLNELNQIGRSIGRSVPTLLEVNISGDTTKHGFAPDSMEPQLANLAALNHLAIRGLMAMASLEGDADDARREFARLRQLRDRLQVNCPPQISLVDLSMGMSGDFEQAIEEGATIVRVGSALFEGLDT